MIKTFNNIDLKIGAGVGMGVVFSVLMYIEATGCSRLSVLTFADSSVLLVPFLKYTNSDLQNKSIIKQNKGKSGIYLWRNLENGKSYVGSAVDIGRRLAQYFNIKNLRRDSCMAICRALLKHGYSNFTVWILEYCDKNDCIKREQYFIDLLEPEYNILRTAGSPYGRKHTEETKTKISAPPLGGGIPPEGGRC